MSAGSYSRGDRLPNIVVTEPICYVFLNFNVNSACYNPFPFSSAILSHGKQLMGVLPTLTQHSQDKELTLRQAALEVCFISCPKLLKYSGVGCEGKESGISCIPGDSWLSILTFVHCLKREKCLFYNKMIL